MSKSSFFQDFKAFAVKGNAVDLAVGVIIGGAFNKIISSLVNDLIMPVVGILLGGIDFTNLELTIPNFLGGSSAAHLRYGIFIQNVVDFLIVAFCVFIFIRIINKFTAKNVNNANTNVTAIFPVTFAPPGIKGNIPKTLLRKMKKNAVQRYGENRL